MPLNRTKRAQILKITGRQVLRYGQGINRLKNSLKSIGRGKIPKKRT